MSEGLFPPRARCAVHDLAAGPDGMCVRCRRLDQRTVSRRVLGRFAVGLAIVLAVAFGYRGAMALRRIGSERTLAETSRVPPPTAAEEIVQAAPSPRPAAETLTR